MLEASRQFGMTQSAVSQAVRRAEAAVGVAVFNRSRRPLTPTRAGRILADRVLDLNRDFDVLLSTLRAAAEQSARVDLRLGLVASRFGHRGTAFACALLALAAVTLTAFARTSPAHAVRHD